MEPIRNDHNKAFGGLWTSTYFNGTSAWVEWCEDEQYHFRETRDCWILTVNTKARIYTIDSLADLEKLYIKYPHDIPGMRSKIVDYEKIQEDYDAIHLTSQGQWKTRMTSPLSLYGWECESTHWFRWSFDKVEYVGKIKE